ncbi:MAG: ABC transporter permease [Deltaproteobacteria bacterium]|nr:ABC transporter permease [Deltaproteobacteria bacterium]
MIIRRGIYFFRTAISNMFHNRLVHMISVGTITISMLLLGFFLLLSVNIKSWLAEWGESLSMSVYVEGDLDELSRAKIESEIKKLRGAVIKEFITKEQALASLKGHLGDQAGLLEGLKVNPLPGSYEVIFKETEDYRVDPEKVKADLEKINGVDEVQYSRQWVERFQGIMDILRVIGLVTGGFLCAAVLFITTNTIKLTIYSRQDEIDIYKLVGATDWFVRIPYLIEGTVQGLLGGIFSYGILIGIYSVFSIRTIQVFGLPLIDFQFLPVGYSIALIGLSLVLGFTGGLVAIGRFFRV